MMQSQLLRSIHEHIARKIMNNQTTDAIGNMAPLGVAADTRTSGVSWGAIFAGAAAAAALSFVLLVLGMGLGLSAVSPYEYNSAPLGTAAIVWIAFMQLAASAMGGFLAGRLRVKWSGIHTDEVHFRDTAHGLLAWALATLLAVAVLGAGARAALGGAVDAVAGAGKLATAAATATGNDGERGRGPMNYFADMMLRAPGQDATDAQRSEMNRIIAIDIASGQLSAEDRSYMGGVIAKRTGLSQEEAERRVDQVYNRAARTAADAKARAQAAAETARKAAQHSALWMFVALMLGAFIASMAATWGGCCRDHERVVTRITP
jgi:hypothetical protein